MMYLFQELIKRKRITNDNLKIYFGNKTEYVKSFNTNNINNARLITKYLISKFIYMK